MPGTLIALSVFYLAAGGFWWHRIVLPGPLPGKAEDWRGDLAQASQRGDISLLIVKGTFVLLWPLALGWGWVSAKLH